MSSPKRTILTIAAFVFVAVLIPIIVIITAKNQFGLDEMMGPELDAGFIATWPETADGMSNWLTSTRTTSFYDLGMRRRTHRHCRSQTSRCSWHRP